ncbi:hypothetical protein VNO77_05436 [Canavalia gladiata]|uniref:Uncharacterized protein n=1 Tax=Canavalia gladiata TaxID=3824 RepID=A0AAN9MYD5_CANGL
MRLITSTIEWKERDIEVIKEGIEVEEEEKDREVSVSGTATGTYTCFIHSHFTQKSQRPKAKGPPTPSTPLYSSSFSLLSSPSIPFTFTMLPTKPNPFNPSPNQHQPSSSSSSLPPLSPQPPPISISNNPTSLDSSDNWIGDSDLDITTMIANFIDHPNAQFTSLDHHESNANGDEPDARGFLKRGIAKTVDYLDVFATPKRTRTNNGDFNAVRLDFEFQNPSPHSGSFNGERVDDDNGDAVLDQDQNKFEERNEPLVLIDFLSNAVPEAEFETQNSDNDANLDMQPNYIPYRPYDYRGQIMGRFRMTAKENASRFARFTPDEAPSPAPEVEKEIDHGSTPFAVAMKAIKDREKKSAQKGSSVTWVSKRNQGAKFSAPSLQELCLKILANNADAIVSLEGIPDELRHRLSQLLCDSRKMNSHFFGLLISGSPTEIRLKDCSWLTEEQFMQSFKMCDPSRLEVLQLDQCGRCIPDYALLATLTQSQRCMPRLTSLSLSGACRLSDNGLNVLVSSAPVLRSINLSQCSLLTSASLDILANSFGSVLKELYLDDCQIKEAASIVPALKKLEHLEVLSLSGIQTVCDVFIKDYIIARGHNMKELVLKDCIKLTDASIKVIAEHCPGLCALDLTNLYKLTDLSIGYVTNNCQALHTLKLCRQPFSDEAIAAFVEITGESLKELSLNNIKKVGHHTTLSLARRAKNLHTLDLSWCRNLMDSELGLIVDSCLSLRLLKLFGCSQVTDVFLNGHSNPEIQIVGLKMSPLLQHVKVHDPHQGALRYSSVSVDLI